MYSHLGEGGRCRGLQDSYKGGEMDSVTICSVTSPVSYKSIDTITILHIVKCVNYFFFNLSFNDN